MPLNIVLFAYCDVLMAMWHLVDLSEKIFQSPFVVEHTLLHVHLASFRIHRIEYRKKTICHSKHKLCSSIQMCHLIVTWTSRTTQQRAQCEAIGRGRLLLSVYTINRHRRQNIDGESFSVVTGARREWRRRHSSMEDKSCRREVLKTDRGWCSHVIV